MSDIKGSKLGAWMRSNGMALIAQMIVVVVLIVSVAVAFASISSSTHVNATDIQQTKIDIRTIYEKQIATDLLLREVSTKLDLLLKQFDRLVTP